MKKSHWRHLKNKWVVAGLVVLAIIIIFVARSGGSASKFETAMATVGNVSETVGITGTISPVGKADLAFEKSGVISRIFVKVGDTVKNGDPIAELDSAGDRAALASAEATLADLSRNLTPEEFAVQKSALESAKRDALNASHDALVKAENALFNYTDAFFTNPQSSNPTLSIRADSSQIQSELNLARVKITVLLDVWSDSLIGVTADDAVALIAKASTNLSTIKDFMNRLSTVVSALLPGNSGLTQATVNAYVTTMNSGLSALNGAIDAVTASQTALFAAQSNYDLKLAGNSAQSIAAQSAKVAGARASLAQDMIVSPIDGIVTRVDPYVGEFAAAGQSGFAVQNDSFKIEARVPEADIAKVAIGNIASSTLDAYGAYVDFPARVVMIDPAETVIEGVPTYKVTLVFLQPDMRIRSGMTANLDIRTNERYNVLYIPYRAVVDDNGAKTVRIVDAGGQSFSSIPVTTGLKGSEGTIEILSGLSEGDKVVTYVK